MKKESPGNFIVAAKIYQGGKINIPSIIRTFLDIKDGEHIGFFSFDKGLVLMGKLPEDILEFYKEVDLIKKDPN